MTLELSDKKTMDLIEAAYADEEIAAARKALARHLQTFPESRNADRGHILPFLEENAKQRSHDSHRLGLSETDRKRREALLKSAASVRDPLAEGAVVALVALEASLRKWLQEHGDDAAVSQIAESINDEYEMVLSLQQNEAFKPKEAFAA